MRQYFSIVLTFAAANMCSVPPAVAQVCDTIFIPSTGFWQVDLNWDNHRPDFDPNNLKVGCIPSGKSALIVKGICSGGANDGEACLSDSDCATPGTCVLDPDVAAKQLVVDGELLAKIATAATLTIHGNSRVDGVLHIEQTCKLLIAGDVTITGEGGILRGDWDPGFTLAPARIEAAPGAQNAKLTIKPPVGNDNSDVTTSLKLHEVWTIDVEFVNNAYVMADWGLALPGPDGKLVLQGEAKSGSGFWMSERRASGGFGVLVVDTTVTGSGTWKMDNVVEKIEINATCLNLTGNVEISAGLLEINRNLTTSGNLAMTGGSITVATGKKVNFD